MSVKRPGELALSADACTQNKPAVNPGRHRGYTTRIISAAQAASTSLTLPCMRNSPHRHFSRCRQVYGIQQARAQATVQGSTWQQRSWQLWTFRFPLRLHDGCALPETAPCAQVSCPQRALDASRWLARAQGLPRKLVTLRGKLV